MEASAISSLTTISIPSPVSFNDQEGEILIKLEEMVKNCEDVRDLNFSEIWPLVEKIQGKDTNSEFKETFWIFFIEICKEYNEQRKDFRDFLNSSDFKRLKCLLGINETWIDAARNSLAVYFDDPLYQEKKICGIVTSHGFLMNSIKSNNSSGYREPERNIYEIVSEEIKNVVAVYINKTSEQIILSLYSLSFMFNSSIVLNELEKQDLFTIMNAKKVCFPDLAAQLPDILKGKMWSPQERSSLILRAAEKLLNDDTCPLIYYSDFAGVLFGGKIEWGEELMKEPTILRFFSDFKKKYEISPVNLSDCPKHSNFTILSLLEIKNLKDNLNFMEKVVDFLPISDKSFIVNWMIQRWMDLLKKNISRLVNEDVEVFSALLEHIPDEMFPQFKIEIEILLNHFIEVKTQIFLQEGKDIKNDEKDFLLENLNCLEKNQDKEKILDCLCEVDLLKLGFQRIFFQLVGSGGIETLKKCLCEFKDVQSYENLINVHIPEEQKDFFRNCLSEYFLYIGISSLLSIKKFDLENKKMMTVYFPIFTQENLKRAEKRYHLNEEELKAAFKKLIIRSYLSSVEKFEKKKKESNQIERLEKKQLIYYEKISDLMVTMTPQEICLLIEENVSLINVKLVALLYIIQNKKFTKLTDDIKKEIYKLFCNNLLKLDVNTLLKLVEPLLKKYENTLFSDAIFLKTLEKMANIRRVDDVIDSKYFCQFWEQLKKSRIDLERPEMKDGFILILKNKFNLKDPKIALRNCSIQSEKHLLNYYMGDFVTTLKEICEKYNECYIHANNTLRELSEQLRQEVLRLTQPGTLTVKQKLNRIQTHFLRQYNGFSQAMHNSNRKFT